MRNVKTNQMNACRCNSEEAGVKITSWLNNNFKLLALTLLAVLSSSVVWGADTDSWNLAQASYSSSSNSAVVWSGTGSSITLSKGSSQTNANNYLGGTYAHTRIYAGHVLTFTPATDITISSIVITATSSDYAGYFSNATKSNCTTSTSSSTCTVTPTDGTKACSLTIGTTTCATKIEVTYTSSIGAGTYEIVPNNVFWGKPSQNGSVNVSKNTNFGPVTQKGITFSMNSGNSTNSYMNSTQSRAYNGYTVTVSVPVEYNITAITFTGSTWNAPTANVGTMNSKAWTGKAASVTFSFTGTGYMEKIVITYEEVAPSCTTPPTVSSSLSGISSTTSSITATVGITSIGGCDITENGLVYSTTNPTPTVGGTGCSRETETACGSTAANKTVTISGLACGQRYYVCGYATNAAGTRYSDVSQISTSACPVDHFIDNIQETTGYTGDGKAVSTSFEKSSITLSDKAATTSGSCEEVHYHFVGWVTEADRSAGNVDAEHIVNFQDIGNVPTGTTYYAVWAKEAE